MNILTEVSNSVVSFLQTFFASFWPILIAILILLFGVAIAFFLRSLWQSLSQYLQIEKKLTNASHYKDLVKTSDKLSLTNLISFLIWWVTIFVFSSATFSLLGLNLSKEVSLFVGFLPSLTSALVVIIVGFFAAYLGYFVFFAFGTLIKLPFASLAAKLFAGIILGFSTLVLLQTLGVSQEFQRFLLFAMIIVVGFSVALALKDPLSSFIKKQF